MFLGLVLIGFRDNVPFTADESGRAVIPQQPAELHHDYRVRWTPPVGTPLTYTGITLTHSLDGRPLEATDDLNRFGFGRTYYDWDLPRMLVTAAAAVPRAAVLDVGGFRTEFDDIGWGCEDTYLGACLIAVGLMVAPLRQVVAHHINPPDEDAAWKTKLSTWPDTVALYRKLLTEPAPTGQSDRFLRTTDAILRNSEVTR